MLAHELAYKLLAQPNIPVIVPVHYESEWHNLTELDMFKIETKRVEDPEYNNGEPWKECRILGEKYGFYDEQGLGDILENIETDAVLVLN